MFVAIENKDMDAFKVEEWINRTREASEGKRISPEFAMEILGKTNFYGHIKKVLKNIKEKNKTKEELLAYKDFVLSCVDGREMSPNALEMLQEIADVCGVRDEFDEINDKTKIYELKDCENVDVKIIKTKKEFYELGGENLRIFFDADKIDLSSCCFSNVKSLKFREGSEVNLSYSYGLPKDLDVSMCSKVNLCSCDLTGISFKFREDAEVNLCSAYNFPIELDLSMWSKVDLSNCYLDKVEKIMFREGAHIDLSCAHYLPKELDLSMCSVVDFFDCDLIGVKKIKFREGAKVSLQEVWNLPKNLDVSMCSEVDLSHNDLEKLKLKFREGAIVNLSYAESLPKDLDVSMCSKVDLSHSEIMGLKLKFREGAEVDLSYAADFPKELDLSMCSKVNLTYCSLYNVEKIKFKEGAEVCLEHADNLPKELDLSMCSKVNMCDCDLSGVEKIKFKDKEQKKEFMKKAKNFSGKVEYVGDVKGNCLVSGNGGMEM